MRLLTLTCLGLALTLASPLTVASPGEETFQVGEWTGRANFNADGVFTDCTVMRPDPEQTTVGFVMTHGDSLGMIVADPVLKLKAGTKKPVIVQVDGVEPLAAMADVVAETGVLVPLEEDGPVLQALKGGKAFRVSVREKEFKLQRPKAGAALEALESCVKSNRGKERVEL